MITLRQFIAELDSLKEELKDKEIVTVAPNGLLFQPKANLMLKDKHDVLNFSKENVERIVIGIQH